MNYYKWYDNKEMPDKPSYDNYYLVMFNNNGSIMKYFGQFRQSKNIDKWASKPFWVALVPWEFFVSQEDIIAWMPIKFPEKIELKDNTK